MPQSTPERRARWSGPSDEEAEKYLRERGWVLSHKWDWIKPDRDHVPTEEELDAIQYLIEEWDFGGIMP